MSISADDLRREVVGELRAQVAELTAERDRWKTAYETATDPRLLELHIENGIMEGRIDGRGMAQIMAAAFWDLLTKEKAQNYVEMTLERGGQELIVHVQKRAGKTPHQLRVEAEAARDVARQDVEERTLDLLILERERDKALRKLAAAEEEARVAREALENLTRRGTTLTVAYATKALDRIAALRKGDKR